MDNYEMSPRNNGKVTMRDPNTKEDNEFNNDYQF